MNIFGDLPPKPKRSLSPLEEEIRQHLLDDFEMLKTRIGPKLSERQLVMLILASLAESFPRRRVI